MPDWCLEPTATKFCCATCAKFAEYPERDALGGGEGFGVTESYLMYQNLKYHRYGTGAQPGSLGQKDRGEFHWMSMDLPPGLVGAGKTPALEVITPVEEFDILVDIEGNWFL